LPEITARRILSPRPRYRVQTKCEFHWFSGWHPYDSIESPQARAINCCPDFKMRHYPGVEPVFPEKRQAINYAQERACFRSGEILVLNSNGAVERVIPFNDTERKL